MHNMVHTYVYTIADMNMSVMELTGISNALKKLTAFGLAWMK